MLYIPNRLRLFSGNESIPIEAPIDTLAPVYVFFAVVIGLSTLVTYPFYCYTLRKNDPEERGLPVYPFIRHFSRVAFLIELSCVWMTASLLLFNVFLSLFRDNGNVYYMSAGISSSIFSIFYSFWYLISLICAPGMSIIFLFFSIQRFVIFHYDHYPGRLIQMLKKPPKYFFVSVYLIVLTFHQLPSGNYSKDTLPSASLALVWDSEPSQLPDIICDYPWFFVFGCSLDVISCLLYVSIAQGIRKLQRDMSSVPQSSSHFSRHIIIQTVITIVLKTIVLCTLFFREVDEFLANVYEDIWLIVFLPLIIHLSYLFSSRHNLRTARTMDISLRTLNFLFERRPKVTLNSATSRPE